jgi:hypothetical protein
MSPDTAQLIKEIAKPQIIQQPSKIIPPIYPDLGYWVNAGYEWIRVYGGWGITNKFRPGDYYNGQRALEILLSAAATGAKYAAPYVVHTANVLSRITYPAPIFPNPNLILPLINPAPIRN